METTGNVNSSRSQLQGEVAKLPKIDATLTKGGYSADAKVVGDALTNHMTLINELRAEIEALKGANT